MVELQMEFQEFGCNIGGLAILLIILDNYWGCAREVGSIHVKLMWGRIIRYIVADDLCILGVALVACFIINDHVCFHLHGVDDLFILQVGLGAEGNVLGVARCQGKCCNIGVWFEIDRLGEVALVPEVGHSVGKGSATCALGRFPILLGLCPVLGAEDPKGSETDPRHS